MKKKEKKEYLKILELDEKASRDDIENAYSHFVKLYSSDDAPEIHPLREEIRREERKKILADIDHAYKALVGEDAVNRMEFSAEIEPQEIILDEDDEMSIEHESFISPEDEADENEPIVEFELSDESEIQVTGMGSSDDSFEGEKPLVEIPLETSGQSADETEEPLFEDSDSESADGGIPAEIERQVIEVDQNGSAGDEGEEISMQAEDLIEHETIDMDLDISLEEMTGEETFEEVTEDPPPEKVVAEKPAIGIDVEITGDFIKKQRELRKLKVRDVGELLNISYKDVVSIENEKFDKLNDPGYLRWLIKSYSKLLGIAEDKSAEDYMKRYRAKK